MQHLWNYFSIQATSSRKARKARKEAYYTASFGHKRVHVYRRKTPSGNWAFMVADTSEVSEDGRVKRRFVSHSVEAVAKAAADTLAERLEWSDIDLTARHIVVAASKSRTASRRIVPIADNLAAWLTPYAGKQGKVWSKLP